MKNKIFKSILALFIVSLVFGGGRVLSELGSESDPLVSLSFVEAKIDQLKYYIDSKLGEKGTATVTPDRWEPVEVGPGKSLICKEGTEIILRSGTSTAISVEKNGIVNGLTDVTAGRDLKMGEVLMENHHIIVPRDDGRGALVVSNSFFLVKGDYEIR